MFDIWNNTNDLADQIYRKGNYKIVDNMDGENVCIIYCSSNDIWFPNEKINFIEAFVEKDRYEWESVESISAKRKIYIRDIYKSWYVTGINDTTDSIDKLVTFLRTLAGKLPIVLIGSSSGGYLAALLSTKLPVKYAVVFSAQFELRNEWAKDYNPFLIKFESDICRSQYYDLLPLLEKSDVPIYYVVPALCERDICQYKYVSGINCIKPILFKSKYHGVVLPKCCIGQFISKDQNELEKIYIKYKGRIQSPIGLSIQLVGLCNTIIGVTKQSVKKIKRKVLVKINR